MKRVYLFIILIFLISVSIYSDKAYLDIFFTRPDDRSVFTLYKSWDMSNPTQIQWRDGQWKRSYELDEGNYYFIEIRDKDDKVWYAYKFTLEGTTRLEKHLGMQKVLISAGYRENKGDLYLIYDDNRMKMTDIYADSRYEIVVELPINEKIELFFQNKKDTFNYGPVEYSSNNIIDRKMKLEFDN